MSNEEIKKKYREVKAYGTLLIGALYNRLDEDAKSKHDFMYGGIDDAAGVFEEFIDDLEGCLDELGIDYKEES